MPGAAPDNLMDVMRTVVVAELTAQQTMGFVVLNRPHSVKVALEKNLLVFPEPYVLIAETDHLLMKALPNLATEDKAVGYPFHYMLPTRNPKTIEIVRRFAGSDDVAKRVQQMGPSPVLIHMESLKKLINPWHDLSFALKKDPSADAEFGWMLEMWGYSIGAAVGGVPHTILEPFQIEPSQQFGVRVTDYWKNNGELTHHVLHYTFGHQYSREGIPTIDSKDGAWGFDKRPYQQGLPRFLRPPPRCAHEATHRLWSMLHEAMAAHDGDGRCDGCTGAGSPWPNGTAALLALSDHDTTVQSSVTQLPQSETALQLIGTGPWKLSDGNGPFYFLRGGQLHTPWGSGAWAAKSGDTHSSSGGGDPIALYFCGRASWTHTLRLEKDPSSSSSSSDGAAAAAPKGLAGMRLVITAKAGDVLYGHLDLPSKPAAEWVADAGATPHDSAQPHDELVAALLGREEFDLGPPYDATSPKPLPAGQSATRRRLTATGPWSVQSGLGTLFLLANGVAHLEAPSRMYGRWRVEKEEADPSAPGGVRKEGATILLQHGSTLTRLHVSCWRMEIVNDGGRRASDAASLVWSHPASRCFPTCSDRTHTLTAAEKDISPLAQRAMRLSEGNAKWTWAGIPGMKFTFNQAEGGGVLVTPWGHGTWGVTPSRADVLVAEFAQKRHMLQFAKEPSDTFVSTRCDDGEVVQGKAV